MSARILWRSRLFRLTGYEDESRHFLCHLIESGVPIAADSRGELPSGEASRYLPRAQVEAISGVLGTPAVPGYVHVQFGEACDLERDPLAGYHIGRTMYETDRLPAGWKEACDGLDEVWVPSEHAYRVFQEAGVGCRLLRVPEGVDADRFRPGLAPLEIPGLRGTTFLAVFAFQARKGWDVLLRAWAQAFGPDDDVCLVLRTHLPGMAPGDPAAPRLLDALITREALESGRRRKDLAPVILVSDPLPAADLPHLYATADALVAPSRGEGWGRPHMEAMACGLPVIATRWSGNLDFMNDENSLLIDVEGMTPVGDGMPHPGLEGHLWAEPSAEHLSELMRQVARGPGASRDLGRRARSDVERNWRWESVGKVARDRLLGVLEELDGAFRHDFEPGSPTEGREAVFFYPPIWAEPHWVEVVRSFCAAFERGQASLVLWIDPSQRFSTAEAYELLQAVLAGIGRAPDGVPDIVLEPGDRSLAAQGRQYAAADCIVAVGQPLVRHRAGLAGRAILDGLDPRDWRAAAALAAGRVDRPSV